MNELELLAAADPATFMPTAAARDELFADITAQLATPSELPSWRRHRWTIPVISAALALTGAGVAYAVLSGQPAQTALKINCGVGITLAQFKQQPEFTNVLDTSTGDPVADCASEFARQGHRVPPLAAYDVGGEMVYVIPASWPAPATWRPLSSAFRSDAARLELQQRLGDLVDGPRGTCTSAADAERYARAQMADLGLDFTIQRLSQAGLADGRRGCALIWVDDGGRPLVLLQGVANTAAVAGSGPTARDIAKRLRAWISDACVSLPEADQLARRAVTDAGFIVHTGEVKSISDPAARCTRVDLVPAGELTIVLRGPVTAG